MSFGIAYSDYPPLGSELVGRTSPGPGLCKYDFGKNLPQCARFAMLSCGQSPTAVVRRVMLTSAEFATRVMPTRKTSGGNLRTFKLLK